MLTSAVTAQWSVINVRENPQTISPFPPTKPDKYSHLLNHITLYGCQEFPIMKGIHRIL